jgi:hypothetical protein
VDLPEIPGDLELLVVLLALLPGFLTAQVIDALVVREERTTFDRIIQALIFTFLSHVLWLWVRPLLPVADQYDLLGLAISALLLGLILTWAINIGAVHRFLRLCRLTRAASRPSEWYDAFYDKQQHVILHFKDGRRIFGWPRIYPFRPDKGHILLEAAEWLDRPGKGDERRDVDFLIEVGDIRFVEFVAPKKRKKE